MNRSESGTLADFTPSGSFQVDVGRLNSALLRHTAFIFISSRREAPTAMVTTAGTASLLRIGNTDLIATCEHVFSGFEAIRQDDPMAVLGIGVCYEEPVLELRAPESRIRARSKDLDLVALDYPRLDHLSNGAKSYLNFADFAEVELNAGDTIVFTGFPKSSRQERGNRIVVDAPPLPFEVTSVSDETIHVVAVGNNREVFEAIGEGFGGYSGSLAFVFKHGRYTPVGLVKEWSRLMDGHIRIVRIGCLLRLLSTNTQ